MEDNFKHKANSWDNPIQIEMTKKFARQISNSIFLYEKDTLAEVGCGTGLVGLELVKKVDKIYMIDNSPSMLKVLREKINESNRNKIEIIEGEFGDTAIKDLSGVICFMTLHHIEDISSFIDQVKERVKDNGFLAIGDLVEEDGSFHSGSIIPHFGFDVENLSKILEEKGFIILRKSIYDSVLKNDKNYPIFLIIAQK